jgi:hypothetical protein
MTDDEIFVEKMSLDEMSKEKIMIIILSEYKMFVDVMSPVRIDVEKKERNLNRDLYEFLVIEIFLRSRIRFLHTK